MNIGFSELRGSSVTRILSNKQERQYLAAKRPASGVNSLYESILLNAHASMASTLLEFF